jgi:hypothetical protein
MRKSDKLKNFKKVNLLAEQRYLQSKGIVTESVIEPSLEEANAFDDYEQEYNQHEEIKYISPERKSEIETLANKYELSGVKSDKGVGGVDPVTYVRLEFYKLIGDRPKYFWVNIIKGDVKIDGKENLQSMIPDEIKRHQFMMDVKNLVNSILENELA